MQAKRVGIQKDQAQTGNYTSETAKRDYDIQVAKLDRLNGAFAGLLNKPNLTHDDFIGATSDLVNQGILTPDQGAAAVRNLPGDPAQLRGVVIQRALQGMTAAERLKAMLPQVEYKSNGKTQLPVDINPLTNANPQPITMTTTPESDQSNATTLRGQTLTDNRARHGQDLEMIRAGFNPDGSIPQQGRMDVKAVAEYRTPPPNDRSPVTQAFMRQVMEVNPNYDSTLFDKKKAVQVAYGSGPQGDMLRSNDVAREHIAQLRPMIDALNNGDYTHFNSWANYLASSQGKSAATSFEAAKNILADEIMKSVVPGGGGEGERQRVGDALAAANSPKQLYQVLDTYEKQMAAARAGLIKQRDAGLNPPFPTTGTQTQAPVTSGFTPQQFAPNARPPLSAFHR
jgi:hypothetical protein